MGFILLEGGNEFNAGMAAADQRAMTVGGGPHVPIRIIPAAAAPDKNDLRAGANGVAWFQTLGAADVRSLPIIDRASTGRSELANELETARIIFMLGGFTRYLAETLAGSLCWEAMRKAYSAGAVIGGSSAGAMVLCEHYFDPISEKVFPGLYLLSGVCAMPHHESLGKKWPPRLAGLLPKALLVGIDEETGMINDGPAGEWAVYGKGAVTIYETHGQAVFHHGERFVLPINVKH